MRSISSADETLEAIDVSRETAERLRQFVALVEKWTRTVNLISKDSVAEIWTRHILDSAQLYSLAPAHPTHWLDLGSGGGFPGIVCALLARDHSCETRFTLVESDKRKSAFLSTASKELELSVSIQTCRIELLEPQDADVVTARALASLAKLLTYAEPHVSPHARLIFPKGAKAQQEIQDAKRYWRFTHEEHQSITSPEARILVCSVPQRRDLTGHNNENDLHRKSEGRRR